MEKSASLDLVYVANLSSLERLRQVAQITAEDMQRLGLDVPTQKLADLSTILQQRYGIRVGTHIAVGSLLEELTKKADDLATDLLVCGATGENTFRHWLLGTTALRLLSTATSPVLVVKRAPRESYSKILVPVDFSPSSLRAIKHARCIAPEAKIVLLHVFEVPFEGLLHYASVDDDIIHRYRVAAKQDVTQKLHDLCQKAEIAQLSPHVVIRHGNPFSCILEQEQEQDCDLIVMGKTGDNVIEKLLLGGVTKHVLDESQCDVFVSV